MSGRPLVMYGVGDVAPYRDNPHTAFRHVAPMMRESDLAFCQLEAVLSEEGDLSSCTRMGCSSRPEVAQALKAAGFDKVRI